MTEDAHEQPDTLGDPRTVFFTDLIGLVRSGDFDQLIGIRETDQIDFKGAAYDLDGPRGRRDLVADVAALANTRGGVLVLGVETTVHQTARIETASRILGIQESAVNEERYLKILHAHIEPLVRDITVEKVASRDDERSHVLGLIVVQPQYEVEKPYLVDRFVNDDDEKVSHIFGWPERSGDMTYWHPLARIQRLVAAGLVGAQVVQVGEDETEADRSLAYELAEVDDQAPSLLIQLVPSPRDQQLPDFFGDALQSLRQWHPLRGAGFGFDTRWHPPVPRGNRLVSSEPGSSFVLSRNGLLTECSSLESRYLGWATPDDPNFIYINAAALTEWPAEAIRTAYEFIGPRISLQGWRIRFVACNLLGERAVRIHWQRGFFPWTRSATDDTIRIELGGTGSWEGDAFTLLAEIWGQGFGEGEQGIVGADAGARRVDLRRLDRP